MTTELLPPPGLKGLPVLDTTIGTVRGDLGFYHYREYPAPQLARDRSVEDVWELLVDGALPDPGATRFRDEVRAARSLPPDVRGLLQALPRSIAPLDGLRAMLSVYASVARVAPVLDMGPAERRRDVLRVAAVVPTMLAAVWRHTLGLPPVDPDIELGHGANFLTMINGERPSTGAAQALERYLVLTMDHGLNASTFTARVVTSTGADVVAAVLGAIGSLSGPLHGGAPSRVLAMLDDIGPVDAAQAWVGEHIERGDRLMGFGHAVYRTDDPRSVLLRETAEQLGTARARRAVAIEPIILDALRAHKPDRVLATNVEYYAAVVLEACGLPPEMFTPAFTVSRVIGWSAHILEQAAEGVLFRPSGRYVGTEPLTD